jgi:hypothetical protein
VSSFQERKSFKANAIGLEDLYNKLSKQNINQYTTNLWEQYNINLVGKLLPNIPFDFLGDREIAGSMFVNEGGSWMDEQIKFLESQMKQNALRRILVENKCGKPEIKSSEYQTSHNSIHHLYHLVKYQHETKKSLLNKTTIIEWGGGYGNFAKLFFRLNPYQCTYIVIDTPLFIVLQKAYLATTVGKDYVHLVENKKDKIHEGKINLLPLGLLESKKLNCDTFISTWALSESSKYSQDYVAKRKYFGAANILMAYQDSYSDLPDASRIEDLITKVGGAIYDIPFIKTSQYAFL